MSTDSLQAVIDFLRNHAPFDQMTAPHLEFLAKRVRPVFFARGETVTTPESGPADHLFIIKQGRIQGELPGKGDPQQQWELVSGECFPIGALLARRPSHLLTRAAEETLCYELPREQFEELLHKSPVFHDFCTRRLANLLDSAYRTTREQSAERLREVDTLSTPLRELLQRPPIFCAPETPLQQVLEQMAAEHVGSMIICDAQQRVLGLFTLRDLLSRVTLAALDPLATPIAAVMTRDPVTLEAQQPAYQAALLMARHGFGHLCVVDNGKLLGMVSERDLFAMQRVGLTTLAQAIQRAESVAQLAELGGESHRLVDQMLAQGVEVEQLTQLITTLNDALTRRVIELVVAQQSEPPPPFTWLAFGSEGRGEQTLKTDQDNGILFTLRAGQDADAVRARLLPLAAQINSALAECGFPLCPGNIMAGNPECCLSAEEWQTRFAQWIERGTPENLLKATIFFDFRPLYGDAQPVRQLRQTLLQQTQRTSRFCRQLAANAMQFRPPLGLFGDFKLSDEDSTPHSLDLKSQGITPFVDAARVFALAAGVGGSNSSERLLAVAAAGQLNADDVAAWNEAYHFIQLLRMQSHRRQAQQGKALSNRLNPDQLNDLERRILKEAFRQARKLQSKLVLEYQL
jgi:CBS domain-containing protein